LEHDIPPTTIFPAAIIGEGGDRSRANRPEKSRSETETYGVRWDTPSTLPPPQQPPSPVIPKVAAGNDSSRIHGYINWGVESGANAEVKRVAEGMYNNPTPLLGMAAREEQLDTIVHYAANGTGVGRGACTTKRLQNLHQCKCKKKIVDCNGVAT